MNAPKLNSNHSSVWYQKDYTKLEGVFNAAVERIHRKKIIYYASNRLYSEDSRRKMAKESYKPVAWATPLELEDIHTELIQIARDTKIVPISTTIANDEASLLSFLEIANDSVEENVDSKKALELYKKAKEKLTSESRLEEEAFPLDIENKVDNKNSIIEITEASNQSASLIDRYNSLKAKFKESVDQKEIPKKPDFPIPDIFAETEESEPVDDLLINIDLPPLEDVSSLNDSITASKVEETIFKTSKVSETITEEKPIIKSEPNIELSQEFLEESLINTSILEKERNEEENIAEGIVFEKFAEIEEEPEVDLDNIETSFDNIDSIASFNEIAQELGVTETTPVSKFRKQRRTNLDESETTLVDELFSEKTSENKSAVTYDRNKAEEINKAYKDNFASKITLLFSSILLIVYIIILAKNFQNYDFVGLILTAVGIFLAWDLNPKFLTGLTIAFMAVQIGFMLFTINLTGYSIGYVHYIWLLFIPLMIISSYIYYHSKRRYLTLIGEKSHFGTEN